MLTRDRLGLSRPDVENVLDFLEGTSVHVGALPLDLALPDPDDGAFVEVARTGGADALVTGNLRHFRGIPEAVSPTAILETSSRHNE